MTQRMVCPECETPGVRPSEGCWVCPECGASWSVNPCENEMLLDEFPRRLPPSPQAQLRDRPRRRSGPHLGYWANDDYPHLPYPADFVDYNWKRDERQLIVDYLRNGETKTQWRGSAPCRMCDKRRGNGSRCFTDGTYTWPEGFAHYVEEHGVRPPREFVEHVKRRGSSGPASTAS